MMVLSNTGPGAFLIVQTIVPAPDDAVPDAVTEQFEVVTVALPATLVSVGSVPWLMTSSNGTFIALISANPAVTLDRA